MSKSKNLVGFEYAWARVHRELSSPKLDPTRLYDVTRRLWKIEKDLNDDLASLSVSDKNYAAQYQRLTRELRKCSALHNALKKILPEFVEKRERVNKAIIRLEKAKGDNDSPLRDNIPPETLKVHSGMLKAEIHDYVSYRQNVINFSAIPELWGGLGGNW